MEYIVKLTDFEGPLDLLLHLIEKAKVDIKDIFLSDVTEQYLSYVEEMKELDMETASDFLSIAATLLLIKSRSLLPRPEPLEETDPEMELIRRIEEYKLYKSAGSRLKKLEEYAGQAYYKLPEEFPLPPPEFEIGNISMQALAEAFLNVYRRKRQEEQPEQVREIVRDAFTIQNRMTHIRKVLSRKRQVSFEELFSDTVTRSEVVCVFAGMLELLASRVITVEQEKTFGQIILRKIGA